MDETFDLAIIGAGPAGLEAALSASATGVSTVVVDSFPQAGGQYYKSLPSAFKPLKISRQEMEGFRLAEKLKGSAVERVFNALVWGIFEEETRDGWTVCMDGPDAPKRLRARNLILAGGAYDTSAAFPGWTLPGVMTCGAALILLKNQCLAPFHRVLVTGSGPLLLSVGAHLIDAGVQVACICEANRIKADAVLYAPTALKEWGHLEEGARYLTRLVRTATPYKMGWSVTEVRGQERVEEAVIARLGKGGVPVPGTSKTLEVDGVICGYGLTPNDGLARMIGCRFKYNAERREWVAWRDDMMQTSIPGIYLVGDGAEINGADNARLEGQIAGIAVAVSTGRLSEEGASRILTAVKPRLAQSRRYGRMLAEVFPVKPSLISLANDDTLICRCEEVKLREIKAAIAAGARTVGEVKMITRVGMGNCQGRMCERLVAWAVLQQLAGQGMSPEAAGMFTKRPPLHPLPMGAFLEQGAVSQMLGEVSNGPNTHLHEQ